METCAKAIFCIVNRGYGAQVMETAKLCGAKGGTIIQARGTASKDSGKLFGITIDPEKEIVLILVPEKIADSLLHSLYLSVGLSTPGGGIAFSLPVEDVVGMKLA